MFIPFGEFPRRNLSCTLAKKKSEKKSEKKERKKVDNVNLERDIFF